MAKKKPTVHKTTKFKDEGDWNRIETEPVSVEDPIANADVDVGLVSNSEMPDEAALTFNEAVANIFLKRSEYLTSLMDPRRDVNKECGYPEVDELTVEDFYKPMYEGDPVAARVVEVKPREAWKKAPTVFEDEDVETITPFEQDWDALNKSFANNSLYQDEEGGHVWKLLQEADIKAGIGCSSVIFLGFDDGVSDLTREIKPKAGRKVLYGKVFDQGCFKVTKVDENPSSKRYLKATEYELTIKNSKDGKTFTKDTINVNWSRCVEIQNGEIDSAPRMQRCYKRLLDLNKLYPGSAEMYWQGAFPGLSIETHPNLGGEGDVKINRRAIRSELKNRRHGLQRDLILAGMTAKTVAPQVVDPTPQITVQIEAICILIAVPVRIFKGSERGELASGQDDDTWNERIEGYRTDHVNTDVIMPFVDHLIYLGVLSTPVGFSISWNALDTLSETEQADVLAKRTAAFGSYSNSGADTLMAPMDYLTREAGYSEEEAKEIEENAIKHIEAANPDAEQDAVQGRNPPPPEIEMLPGEENGNGQPAKRPPPVPARK